MITTRVTAGDRQLMRDEETLWSVASLLRDVGNHQWQDRIHQLRLEALKIAREIEQHTDQFEIEAD